MDKEFVPYEEALALKELGFDEPCLGYTKDNEFKMWSPYDCYRNSELKLWFVSHPLYQQAFRWFREKHNLHNEVIWDVEKNTLVWFHSISEIGNLEDVFVDLPLSKSYEEAELVCLRKLIEIVKEKRA